jgi:hypothetical protein
LLRAKQIELSGKSLSLERIAIERSADELEEAEYKSLSEMAIARLNRESESPIGASAFACRLQTAPLDFFAAVIFLKGAFRMAMRFNSASFFVLAVCLTAISLFGTDHRRFTGKGR